MADEQIKTNTRKAGTRNKASNEAIQKESTKAPSKSGKGVQKEVEEKVVLMMPDLTEELKKKEEVDISPYVSNVEGSVYAISGLPEEFIATLFAWVSRSSKSFKEHLRQAAKEFQLPSSTSSHFGELNKKAKDFHEKWTVGYGHSSVAEHATAHVGIESVSRLASAELELANTFLSITEYSQRYQKPERGKWHNPFSAISVGQPLDKPSLHEKLEDFYNKAFDKFELLIEAVYTHLKKEFVHSDEYKAIEHDTKAVDRKLNALMKLAFEDARYALPLSMHTQLGMTANGRAWRDALATLGNSGHAESVKLADDIRTEVTKVLPVLLKYATPSQYQRNSKKRMEALFNERCPVSTNKLAQYDVVLEPVISEKNVIDEIIANAKIKHENYIRPSAMAYVQYRMTDEEKVARIKEMLFEMAHFDTAPEEFKHVKYDAYFTVSEANWHQLLRHNRKTDFTFGNPCPDYGIVVPPRIVESGAQHLLKDIAEQSEELYNELVAEGFVKEAEYVILNAHKRHVYASFNLWEAYHLINLRTSDEAQWDIRETFETLYKLLTNVHPLLMSNAKRR